LEIIVSIQNAPLLLAAFLKARRFQAPLELLSAGRVVPLDAVPTQQQIHSKPPRSMLGRGRIPHQVRPRISHQSVFRPQQFGPGMSDP